jgi:hypothetical protein
MFPKTHHSRLCTQTLKRTARQTQGLEQRDQLQCPNDVASTAFAWEDEPYSKVSHVAWNAALSH